MAAGLGRIVVDAIFPPQCPACRGFVDRHGHLCGACWGQARFITAPTCACCGVPFEYEMGDGGLCLGCIANRPLYGRARSALIYDDLSRKLVLSFKHGDRLDGAGPYAHLMAQAGRELLADADLLVPVPLHWRRMFRRRYNQSAVLANRISGLAGIECLPDGLLRIRATPSQGQLPRKDRLKNVRGAFAVARRHSDHIGDRSILLIDDVLTTGATVNDCARALFRAGAHNVNVLTLARVVLPAQMPV